MKNTNHLLYDFLDFDPGSARDQRVWLAGQPRDISVQNQDIILNIPFIRQLGTNDYEADPKANEKSFSLRIRAYGEKILRLKVDEQGAEMKSSPMLCMDPKLGSSSLDYRKEKERWVVFDAEGKTRACINFAQPKTDHWSELIPAPPELLDLTLYPEENKGININARDQFFPARRDGLHLAFLEDHKQFDRCTLAITAHHDEHFAGSGERFSNMDLRGQSVQLENQDAQGVNSRRAYKNIPFYLSSRMYGLFLHTSAPSKFSFADYSTRSVQLLNEEAGMDLFLLGGENPEEILRGYRQLTGFPALPPRWSFGTWMSRMTYFSAEEVEGICTRLREEDFPCDVIHLDTGWFRTDWLCEWKFNPERFPDPPAFIKRLKDQGFKVSLWQLPYIAKEALQHDEAKENNYIAPLKKSGKQGGSNFSALDYAGTIDFTYPAAKKWYQDLLKELLEMGVSCIKTDFGEDIHLEAEYHGMEARLLHNLYPLLYQEAAFEVTREVSGNQLIWARAAWAGCQRFPVHWGGDAACTWEGMAGSLKGGLQLGLSGFGYWSHDVPGFHGIPDFMNTVVPDDLYLRWTQFGVFTSHLRYHGTSKREPYEYPAIADSIRKWWKLRYALLPYILEQSERVGSSGYPLLRALIFHHPKDHSCWNIHDQYYFGDDFLVAPVMNSENKRDVYLPEGQWINFFTGDEQQGPIWLKDFTCPLEELPLWVRKNAKIPFYPEHINSTDEMEDGLSHEICFNEEFKGLGSTAIGWECGFRER